MNSEREILEMRDTLARIETKIDYAVLAADDHEMRIRALEGTNGKRWELLIAQIIQVIAAAVIGWMLAGLA